MDVLAALWDWLASVWTWLAPALVWIVAAALAVLVVVLIVRRRRRSPAARAAAERERADAGAELVRLDDAIAELDLDMGLSGARYDGSAPASLRRIRMTSQHTRDAAFDDLLSLGPQALPADITRVAHRIRLSAVTAHDDVDRARADHEAWMDRQVSPTAQVEAARARAREIGAELGDPGALLAALSQRYDRSEWVDAQDAATVALAGLAEAEDLIDEAERDDRDAGAPRRPLREAERSLRSAQDAARRLEERYRLVSDASAAVAGEIAGLRTAMEQAAVLRTEMSAADAERIGSVLAEMSAEAAALEGGAARHPMGTVRHIVALRTRLDGAVGPHLSAQQRARSARTALPSTLAAAREAIASAEPRTQTAGADARASFMMAQRDLAAARAAHEPVEGLDAARRAIVRAGEASAIARNGLSASPASGAAD